jgi:hypothetical protein
MFCAAFLAKRILRSRMRSNTINEGMEATNMEITIEQKLSANRAAG